MSKPFGFTIQLSLKQLVEAIQTLNADQQISLLRDIADQWTRGAATTYRWRDAGVAITKALDDLEREAR